MNDLSVNESNVDGYLQDERLYHLCYADDLTLIPVCSADMQALLQLCNKYGDEHELMFNVKSHNAWYSDLMASNLIIHVHNIMDIDQQL